MFNQNLDEESFKSNQRYNYMDTFGQNIYSQDPFDESYYQKYIYGEDREEIPRNLLNRSVDENMNIFGINQSNSDYKNNFSSINNISDEISNKSNNFEDNTKNIFFGDLNDYNDANTAPKTGKKTTIQNKVQETKDVKIIISKPEKNDVQIEISKDKKEEENNGKKKLPQPPYQYLFEEIKNTIFQKLNKDTYKLINNSFKPTAHLRDLEKKMNDETYFADKKRNRDKEKIVNDPKQLGRKRREDISNRDHNRDSEDNIVKKIKAKVIETLLSFII